MADLGNYAEEKLLDALFNASTTGGGLPTANVWLKCHTGAPGEDGTGNAAGHTTRVQASFGAASAGAVSNDAAVAFTSMAAAETISHLSAWDASTGGNHLANFALAASKTVAIGDTLNFAIGEIDFTLA